MRWFSYFILAYLAIGLHIGLGALLEVRGVRPDLVLLAVVFIAMNAPRDAALLGCFGLGVLQDMVSLGPLGLHAFAYSAVGLLLTAGHDAVYREHPLTHVFFTLVGGSAVAAIAWIHALTKGPPAQAGVLFGTALYTALLAPVALGILQRLRGIFGFQPTRRRVRPY